MNRKKIKREKSIVKMPGTQAPLEGTMTSALGQQNEAGNTSLGSPRRYGIGKKTTFN